MVHDDGPAKEGGAAGEEKSRSIEGEASRADRGCGAAAVADNRRDRA
jgi:hypothetical protein